MDQQRQDDIQEVIRGARALAENGDQEGCKQVVAELEDLTQLLDEYSAQAGAQQEPQAGDQPQQAQAGGQQLAEGQQPMSKPSSNGR